MTGIEASRNELEQLFAVASEPDISMLNRLRAYMAYAQFLKDDSVLSRLIASIRERIAYEGINDIQKSIADPVYRRLSELRSNAPTDEDEERQFPMHTLVRLEEGYEEFNLLGDEEDEEKFKKKELRILRETKDREDGYTETISTRNLLIDAEHMYPREVPLLHNALTRELDLVLKDGKLPAYFGYDTDSGTLYIHGQQVKIMSRKTPNNAHYLLSYLFSNNPTDQHFYGEMEEAKVLLEESSWQAYYRACTDIQKKVEDTSGISDFLDFSTGKSLYIRINPKYSLVSKSSG